MIHLFNSKLKGPGGLVKKTQSIRKKYKLKEIFLKKLKEQWKKTNL